MRDIKHTKEEIIEELKNGLSLIDQADDMVSYSEWQDDVDIQDEFYELISEVSSFIEQLKLK
jgi:type III secretion system FlhB-like substrate exporter